MGRTRRPARSRAPCGRSNRTTCKRDAVLSRRSAAVPPGPRAPQVCSSIGIVWRSSHRESCVSGLGSSADPCTSSAQNHLGPGRAALGRRTDHDITSARRYPSQRLPSQTGVAELRDRTGSSVMPGLLFCGELRLAYSLSIETAGPNNLLREPGVNVDGYSARAVERQRLRRHACPGAATEKTPCLTCSALTC